jgi:TorA maturation chaperone TorD
MEAIEAIRDFFLAGNAYELKRSYQELVEYSQNDVVVVTDWQEVEFAFNRLFVGPAALEAPPFSSVYLDAESLVMGKTTLAVREMYGALGLESPWKNSLPDDHISLELDAVLALKHAARQTEQEEIEELRKRFLQHMEAWVPMFAERILKAPSSHPAINYVAVCLFDWLKKQTNLQKEGI